VQACLWQNGRVLRAPRPIPLALLLALAAPGPGCECAAPSPAGDAGRPPDVGSSDAAALDAGALDASGLDASGLDAALDAHDLDTSMPDAPGLDAPETPDAPGLDAAPVDAALVAIDAGPVATDAARPPLDASPLVTRHLYWVEGRTVRRSELDGTAVTTVLSNVPTWVEDLDHDPISDRILLLDTFRDDFVAASTGADCAVAGACPVIHSTSSPVTSFAVDAPGGRIFWSVGSLFGGASGGYGAPLTALADTRFYTSSVLDGTAWDGAYGWVYFGETSGNLRRVRPDGTSPQAAPTTFRSGVARVALDPVRERAYLVVFQPSSARDLARIDVTLGAATLAVTSPTRLVTATVSGGSITFDVTNVAFDVATGRLFWRARRGAMHEIWSGDADGSDATMLRSFTNDGQTGNAFAILED
jgi:hypothetical protein